MQSYLIKSNQIKSNLTGCGTAPGHLVYICIYITVMLCCILLWSNILYQTQYYFSLVCVVLGGGEEGRRQEMGGGELIELRQLQYKIVGLHT